MAGEELTELAVGNDSGICKAGFTGDSAPRAVFPAVALHPQGRLPPLRGAEADSHGPDCSRRPLRFPYYRTHGGRCPCCGGRACSLVSGSQRYLVFA